MTEPSFGAALGKRDASDSPAWDEQIEETRHRRSYGDMALGARAVRLSQASQTHVRKKLMDETFVVYATHGADIR